EAEALAAAGVADRTLLSRALEADPKNGRAQSELARFQHGEIKADDSSRYLAAGAIGFVALGGIAFVLLRREAPDGSEKPSAGGVNASGAPPERGSLRDARTDEPAPEEPNDSFRDTRRGAPTQEPTQSAAHATETTPASAEEPKAEPQKAEEPTSPEGDVSSSAPDKES
ncbi:MAG TPA: hypothetical protein VGL19_00480, partial [Polyangiaceae bacterium]